MAIFINICFSLIILLISLIGLLIYIHKDIESTAKLVSIARYCSLLLNPNYTNHDNYNIGIDNYAKYFIQNSDTINNTCYFFNYFNTDFSNDLSQRTYYFDKQITHYFQNSSDYKQLVLLGAGFDTRAKRFENYLQNITIFEVDLKVTQDRKKAITDKLSWPSNVQFVQTDFNMDSLKHEL